MPTQIPELHTACWEVQSPCVTNVNASFVLPSLGRWLLDQFLYSPCLLNFGVYFFTALTVMEDPLCKGFRYCWCSITCQWKRIWGYRKHRGHSSHEFLIPTPQPIDFFFSAKCLFFFTRKRREVFFFLTLRQVFVLWEETSLTSRLICSFIGASQFGQTFTVWDGLYVTGSEWLCLFQRWMTPNVLPSSDLLASAMLSTKWSLDVIYKAVAKCMVNRLRPLLDGIIFPNQSAFILARLIIDNAFITFECIHTIKQEKVPDGS